jgi:predicted ester cyclase
MPTDAEPETETKPKTTAQIAKAYFGAISDGDLDAAVALWKPGGRDHIHGFADMRSAAEIKGFFTAQHAAFDDWHFEILELAASGKNAACRWRITGTFTGPGRFQGLTPNGKSIAMEGCDMLRVEDGQIVENNAYTNGMLVAQQLGMLPPQGSTADRVVTGAFNAKTAATGAIRKLRER